MHCRMRKIHILALAALMMQGCVVTDDLDLSRDLDIKVSFSADGLTLGGDNTIDIPMSQIIELEKDGNLTVDEMGNYLFSKSSEGADSTIMSVGQGSLSGATEDVFDLPLVADESIIFTPNSRYPDYGSARISGLFWPSYEPDERKDCVREYIYLTTPMTINIEFNFENVEGIEALDEVRYRVPAFYDVADEADLVEYDVPVTGTHRHTIHLKGVNFRPTGMMEGEIITNGTTSSHIEIKGAVGIECISQAMSIAEFKASASPVMHVRVMCDNMGTMAVKGRFDVSEEVDIKPITLDNLPSFITGEEVVLDVENPIVRLSVDSEVPANVELNAEIQAMVGNEVTGTLNVGREHGTSPIRFDGSGRSSVWISRKPVTELPDTVRENIVIEGIADLIRRVPERINVKAFAHTDETEEIQLSLAEEYRVVPSYELYAPVKMGPDMKIVYDKDLNDLASTISHVDADVLTMTAVAENNIPLSLKLTAVPYDEEGRELRQLQVSMPADLPPMTQNNSVTFVIRNAEGRNDLSRLGSIKLKAVAAMTPEMVGSYLNEKQNLRMKNVKLTLKCNQ